MSRSDASPFAGNQVNVNVPYGESSKILHSSTSSFFFNLNKVANKVGLANIYDVSYYSWAN